MKDNRQPIHTPAHTEDDKVRGILFPSPIFGPVHSRRLGVSLGINLLPADGKVCSFDCIYCECGYNGNRRLRGSRFPSREEVQEGLRRQLMKMRNEGSPLDVITFAGNGEPTLHPQFLGVMQDTIALRDEFFPLAKVSVLTNGAQILRQDVFDALMLCDNNIVKLDTVSPDYIRQLDRPVHPSYDVHAIIRRMQAFHGHCIVQTIFLKGTHRKEEDCTINKGIHAREEAANIEKADMNAGEVWNVSNLGNEYVEPWLEAVKSIQPEEVMVYTIDRDTPSPLLEKASPAELDAIAERVRNLGIPCQVSY